MSSLCYEATTILSFYLGPEHWQENGLFGSPGGTVKEITSPFS